MNNRAHSISPTTAHTMSQVPRPKAARKVHDFFLTYNSANVLIHFQSERSHEENQERAYIAASRRTDRSLEARIQSARMASEIHKKRTGKSLRITESIVENEEMYEEEDGDLPRFAVLGLRGQMSATNPQHGNTATMSDLLASSDQNWRQNEVNQMFDQMFPHAHEHARRLSYQQSPPPSLSHQSPPPPFLPQSAEFAPQWTYADLLPLQQVPSPMLPAMPPNVSNQFGAFEFSPATPEGGQSLSSVSSVSSPSLAEYLYLDPSQLQQEVPPSPWL